jgi:collagenase-like PrtC family protease
LIQELGCLASMNISAFRLSPHNHDMTGVARIFRAVLDSKMDPAEAIGHLEEGGLRVPFCNGFYHKAHGYQWVEPAVRRSSSARS